MPTPSVQYNSVIPCRKLMKGIRTELLLMSVKGLVQHEAEPSLESSSSVHVTLVLTIPTDGSRPRSVVPLNLVSVDETIESREPYSASSEFVLTFRIEKKNTRPRGEHRKICSMPSGDRQLFTFVVMLAVVGVVAQKLNKYQKSPSVCGRRRS